MPTDEEEVEIDAAAADREPVTLQGRMHRRESETDEEFYLRLLSRRGTSKTSGVADIAGRRRTSSRTMTAATNGTGAGTVMAGTTGGTQRRREREKRRTASGIAESAASTGASPVRGGTWGIAVDVEGMSMGVATEDVNTGSNNNSGTGAGAGGIASWKTRASATVGVTGSGVRKTSRRVGSYGSVVWAK